MAPSYFKQSQPNTTYFFRKKPEEQQQYFTPQVDWSQYQSRPAQITQQQPTKFPTTPSWQSKPAQKQTFFPTSWRDVQAKTAQATPPPKVQTPPPPGTTPPPTTQPDPTGINPLIAKVREIAQRQTQFQTDQADTRAKQLTEQQGIKQKYADTRVSKLEALRDAAIGRIKETIPLQEQATAEYKAQVEDQSGREMKEQAQAQREEQQGIEGLFAGLNTIDSGAFITQGMKSRERLTANQTATIKARTNELNAADRDLKQFKLQAQELITGEVQKFDDLLLQIAENLEVGTAEYNAAVKQVYDQAKEAILGIEAGLSEKELAYEEKAQELQAEMMKEGMKGSELKDKQAMSLSANNALDDIIMTINGNEGIYKNLNPLDQSKRDYDAKVNNAIDLIIRTRTGAAATEEEVKAMRGMFPSYLDSKQTAMDKLIRLKSGVQSSLLGTPYAGNQSQVVTAPDGQQVIIVD